MAEEMDAKIDQIKNLLNNKNISDNLGNVINMFAKQNPTQNNSDKGEQATNTAFDPQTIQMISKIQKVMGGMNKSDDSKEKLLIALKPHLNKERQDTVDNILNILKITSIMDVMTNLEGSDKNE